MTSSSPTVRSPRLQSDGTKGSLHDTDDTVSDYGTLAASTHLLRSSRWNQSTRDENSHEIFRQVTTRREAIASVLDSYHSPLNYLLVFVPLGIAAGMAEIRPGVVFCLNFLAILPLAMILGVATEAVADHTNDTLGGLLNATFGNVVEILISIQALRKGALLLIQLTLIGSILSNLLLVLGSSFLLGGFVFREQSVKSTVVESNGAILIVAVIGFVLPSVGGSMLPVPAAEKFSLVVSVILLVVYGLFLVFELVTHADLYNGEAATREDDQAIESLVLETQPPSLRFSIGVLFVCCLVVSKCSDYLVDTVDGFSQSLGLSPRLSALIIVPIAGNVAEHYSALTVAMKDKMDLSIGIAVGSSIQIALFAAPFMVLVSWIFGYPHLTLSFPMMETVALVLTVLLVNTTLRDWSTNWLEGALLIACYAMVATVAAFL